MSSLEAVRLVTLREITERGRTKSFLFGGIFVLFLLSAAIVVPVLFNNGEVTWKVGSLGQGNESTLQVAGTIGRDETDPDRGFAFDVTPYDSREEARAALADSDIELVLVDGEEILRQGSSGFGGSDLQGAVQRAAAIAQLDDSLAGSDVTTDQVAGVLNGDPLPVTTVQGESDSDLETARSAIAYVGMFLLYMSILAYGSWTLMGIAEEKSSRVVEVLLSTVKPWHLLTGKILGIGLLGLAQFVATVAWALLLVRITGVLDLPAIPVDSAVALVVWFVLGYAVYSVMYAAVGALVSRMEDVQSVAFPISMIAIVGFLVSFRVLDEPAGTLARIMTFVPFVAPYVVPIRVAFQEIAVWEYLLSIAVTLVTIVVLVRIAARVYAHGLLHFGARMGWRQAYRSVRS
jgi:ABC-2 type transport system permease protein